MLKIDINKNVIPVEIGDIKLGFVMTDENIKNYDERAEATKKNLESAVKKFEAEKIDGVKLIDVLNEELAAMYDLLFGEGTYNKLYKQLPSAMENMDILLELMPAIRKEYDAQLDEKSEERAKRAEAYKERKK